ncbi:MAG: alkylation response protein AidB-like acyl-CoA dehydrogenase [Hyphomicrobiaceae bacterium]|jgi:alkylation response protein AidB-like acyl-CoA dehydrogenase
MNFDNSEEQQMIIDSVRRFVANESPVERFRRMREDERGWEPKVWAKMAEQGWLAVCYPEEQGGFGGSFVDAALILEQLGRGLVPEPYIASVVLAGGLISRLGSPEQIESFLTPMISGETSLALAFAERQSRYNLADCQSSAEKSGAGYVLRGEKAWVLNGHAADQLVVVARTSGDQLDDEGLSLFVVDGDAPGLKRVPFLGMDGQKTALITLDGVEVGADRLLGEEGKALASLEWAVDRGASAACAEAQGELQELFERTNEYLKERKQFGRAIGSFQALQHKMADMFAETELCRGTMLMSALQVDIEDATERMHDVSCAKIQLTDGGWLVQKNAVQLHGGIAVTDEHDAGLFFKRVRVLQGLFGDADHHADRIQKLPSFEAA